MNYNEPSQQKQDLSELYGWQMNTSAKEAAMNTSMVRLWTWMSGRFHPQWTNANGDIGGPMFRAWSAELGKLGPNAVERGIRAIDFGGANYAPNMNKFVSVCRKTDGGTTGGKDAFGVSHKPTPNGVPLCWTQGTYTVQELTDSGIQEDLDMADTLKMLGRESCTQEQR